MPTKQDIWTYLTDYFSQILMENWQEITIDGKTVNDKYGLSRETCERYKLGFAPADISLLDLLTKEFGLSHQDLIVNNGYGFITIPTNPPFRGLNYFNGRLIFPYLEQAPTEAGGTKGDSSLVPVYFSGRITDKTPAKDFAADAKFLHMRFESAGVTEKPLYLDVPFKDPCFLVEGHTHALRLRQEGFAAVAIGGSIPSQSQLKTLERTKELFWIPDVDILAEKYAAVNDTDHGPEYKPALSFADRLNNLLPTIRKLRHCKLVQYPEPFAQRFEKGDQTDWWDQYPDRKDFLSLISNFLDLDSVEIQSISPDLPANHRTQKINDLLKQIVVDHRPDSETDEILAKLKTHLHLSASAITSIKKELKLLRREGVAPPIDDRDFSSAADVETIRPGQAFVRNKLFYTVWKRSLIKKQTKDGQVEDVVAQPFMISSDGDFFAATKTEFTKRKLVLPEGCDISLATYNWSDNAQTPFSIPAFLENPKENTPDTPSLYASIRQYLKSYIYLNKEEYYDFLTVFIFVTYCVQIFDSFGYLALTGTKATGKTRLLELFTGICFNPILSSSQSDSSIFRTAVAWSPTFMMDECENLSSAMKVADQISDKSLILKSSYRQSGQVIRTQRLESGKFVTDIFKTFTTFVLANTRGLEPTIGSRSFYFPMIKCPSNIELENWNPPLLKEFSQFTKNKLHCWTLQAADLIGKTYQRILSGDLDNLIKFIGLRDREREIYTPIITLALAIDELSGHPFKWDLSPDSSNNPPIQGTVLSAILEAQSVLSEKKKELASEEEVFHLFLIGLRQMLRDKSVRPHSLPNMPPQVREGWYQGTEVRKFLNRLEGLKFYPQERGKRALRFILTNTCTILQPADIVRTNLPGTKGRRIFFRLLLDRVEKICRDYQLSDESELEVAELDESESYDPPPPDEPDQSEMDIE